MQNFIKIRLPPFAPNYAKMRVVTRLVFWFFYQPTAKTPAPICTINTSNDVVSRKDVPFGVPKTKFYILTQFTPKKRKFLANFRRDKISRQKGLTMGMLGSKLPLIVIVAP